MDVDDVGLGVEMVFPDLLQQHGARHRLAGVAHQEFQQLKLARLQVDLLALAMHGAGDQVHLQVADLEHRLHPAGLAAARQGLDAGDQLGQGVGLDQIVVGPRLQARDAVLDLAQRRQEQDRRLVAALAHHLDHADAVQARHHPVDDIDVVAALLRFQQAEGAVDGVGDFMPGFGQAAHHGGRGLGIVLNHQNTHGPLQIKIRRRC
ncbi:hypothetical protein D3C77_523330 [compost metagenome]